jgi:acyl transferase domain-containing protein
MTGSSLTILSNRVSYRFNLKGPSLTVDTACSSSLVALHTAVQSIRGGDCTQAIVGGVNIILNPHQMGSLASMRFFSPDGKSYSFDSRGNGYGRGEGVACVLLKRLDQAIKDGDTIRAIIRNTGVNQDGKTQGITMPSAQQQAALIKSTYEAVGLDPSETSYVEAHGTGTAAGDPLEASGLATIFCQNRTNTLHIGSVKSNVGHLEAGSGLAGLVKLVMMLEHKTLLPNGNFEKPNPKLPLVQWRMDVC